MFSSVGLNQASLDVCRIETVSTGSMCVKEGEGTDLLEDVMEESVVAVVVHVPEYST
jgi:hypothetical protein